MKLNKFIGFLIISIFTTTSVAFSPVILAADDLSMIPPPKCGPNAKGSKAVVKKAKKVKQEQTTTTTTTQTNS